MDHCFKPTTGSDGYLKLWVREGIGNAAVQVADYVGPTVHYNNNNPDTPGNLYQLLSYYKPKFATLPTTVQSGSMYYGACKCAVIDSGTDENGFYAVDPAEYE